MVVASTTQPPRIEAARPVTGWDSRVVILRGDDRARLRERIAAVIEPLEREPGADLGALAGSLAAGLTPGGARLGVVATSIADLTAKLRRADGRLADPKCRHIRDSAGIYYFDEPLLRRGKLALLYPGEGAQYPDMLADLCSALPEVEETF